jgi:hypothetical protein
MHTSPPSYCAIHGGVSPNYYPPLLPPNLPISIPSVFEIRNLCQICEEELDVGAPSQICESCRETVKVFKEMFDVSGKMHRKKTHGKKRKKK